MINVLFANNSLFVLIAVVAFLMIGNTLFKLACCSIDGTFDWGYLFQGLRKYGLILMGLGFVILAGSLIPEVSIVTIDNQSLTILQALNMGALALVYIYGKKCLENLNEIFNLKKEIKEKTVEPIADLEEDKG